MTGLAVALLVALAPIAALVAQPTQAPVPVGARVRVGAPPRAGWTTGTVAAADSARIVLFSAPAAADTFLLSSIRMLEVSRGRARAARARAGAGIGLAGGALVGVVAGAIGGRYYVSRERNLIAAGGGVLGALGGSIVGGFVGAATAPERWLRVLPR